MKNPKSYSTINIKHHRNIIVLMVLCPLLVMGLVVVTFYVSNNHNSDANAATTLPVLSGKRDPLKWPFSRYSIWNMPIGSNARYVPANINTVPGNDPWAPMPDVDWEYIFMNPSAPTAPMKVRNDWGGDRCTYQSNTTVTNVPIPTNYVLPSNNGNNSSAFIMPDGRTVFQAQPLARCTPGGYATSINFFQDRPVDIYASGDSSAYGAHGGSDLSALGGSLRVGELRKGGDPPRHALKVALNRAEDMYRCTVRSDCFRWPAFKPDSGAVGTYGVANNNQNKAMKMGALLAIPTSLNINNMGLQTEPAKKLAWTLQNYGAYLNDDAEEQFLIDAERGPAGDFGAQFQADYGFPIFQRVRDGTPWVKDIQKLVAALNVVDNNGPISVGGGGTPLQPLAPCFNNGIECDDPNVSASPSPAPNPSPSPAPSPAPPSQPPSSPSSKPQAPSGVKLTSGDHKLVVAWNGSPSSEGVDSYQVYLNGSYSYSTVTQPTYTITGTAGQTYNVRISAHNSAGYGPWTESYSGVIGDTPGSPPPTPIPAPAPPPVEIPGSNPTTPVEIPVNIPKETDGTIVADFNGDGLNDEVKDTNNDGKIDPKTEIVVDGSSDTSLTDTNKAPITPNTYDNLFSPTQSSDTTLSQKPSTTIRFKAGPLPEVRLAKPVAYTFLIAQSIVITGVGSYLAITKLAVFAGIRGRWGL